MQKGEMLYSKENNRVVTCNNHFECENVNLRICTSMKIKIQQAKQLSRLESIEYGCSASLIFV